jgi:hypothetical protein
VEASRALLDDAVAIEGNSRSSGVHDLPVRCMVTRRLAARRCGKRRSGPGCRAVSA